MNLSLDLIKVLAIAALATGLLLGSFTLICSADTPAHRVYHRYVASVERRMRIMFIDMPVMAVVLAQGVAGLLTVGIAVFTRKPLWIVLLVPVALLPTLVLEHKRKKRVAQIEERLEGFLLALANALRAAPSAGRALAMVQPLSAPPLDREIELVLREMRVGSTLEQALANLSARVRSFQLDAALSCLLIGRQTGGNVPLILDGAALTLREITRLQGVLRTKTAEGRAQANVLAVFPLALIVAFEWVRPGYFEPLLQSPSGMLVVAMAMGMWVTSIVIMRRIMAVQL